MFKLCRINLLIARVSNVLQELSLRNRPLSGIVLLFIPRVRKFLRISPVLQSTRISNPNFDGLQKGGDRGRGLEWNEKQRYSLRKAWTRSRKTRKTSKQRRNEMHAKKETLQFDVFPDKAETQAKAITMIFATAG